MSPSSHPPCPFLLLIRFRDKDFYTSDDPVGSVLVDLSCMMTKHASSGGGLDEIAGYFPLYDSFHGVRGHLYVSIKLNLFQDNNPFKDSSAGVQFFSVSTLDGYVIDAIHGFVEELILEKDPECQSRDRPHRAHRIARAQRCCMRMRSPSPVFPSSFCQITGLTRFARVARVTRPASSCSTV